MAKSLLLSSLLSFAYVALALFCTTAALASSQSSSTNSLGGLAVPPVDIDEFSSLDRQSLEEHFPYLEAIQCPACDYTAGFMVKKALEAHRKCGMKTPETFTPVTFRNGKEGKGYSSRLDREIEATADSPAGHEDLSGGEDADGCVKFVHTFAADGVTGGSDGKSFTTIVASKRTIGRIYDEGCKYGVFKTFPIGTRAVPRVSDEDKRPDEARLADLSAFKPEPADEMFLKGIKVACSAALEKLPSAERKKMKRLLYDLTVAGAGDALAWSEFDASDGLAAFGKELYARRNGDYKRILEMQSTACKKVCGDFARSPVASPNPVDPKDLMERPDAPKKTADKEVSYLGLVSWNALGEIISRDHN